MEKKKLAANKKAILRKVKPVTVKKSKRSARTRGSDAASKGNNRPLCIVGVGASGGGLEAVEAFLTHMPADGDVAIVIVTHLDPTHASIMGDLLTRYTAMDVFQAEDDMIVRKNCVYIIPPGKDMAIMKGSLQLLEPQVIRGMRHPIDFFFRSLAKDQNERAVCIVLSGAGTDGTLGLKDIKGEGGMVMVQEPESAKYDGMPKSAVDSGLADFILPPEKMPEQLLKYVRHPYVVATAKRDVLMTKISENLHKILLLIRSQTGRDFSYYKETTIVRRVERRMNVNQISEVTHYISYLQRNPVEIELLFKELLIGVTSFFRDAEAFETLRRKIVPHVFSKKQAGGTVRVWVPGCSTGEEAYSIAIMLKEYIEKMKKDYNVQIFATDIDTGAIEKARSGIYPDSIASDVSPDRLKRFFAKGDNTFQIKKEVREMVVFAVQDLIKDPPFTRLDLVSCRNLLIYLNPQIQKRLLPLFHFALLQDGILFLGTSETAGEAGDLFATIEKKWKIYRRKKATLAARAENLDFPAIPPLKGITEAQRTGIGRRPEQPVILDQVAKRLLLDDYTPPCVIVNDKNNILYIHGKTGNFLEPAPGEARMNILEMAREGLEFELGRAIKKALTQKKEVVHEGVQVKYDSTVHYIDLEVKPIMRPEQLKGLLLVVFKDAPTPAHLERAARAVKKGEASRHSQIEKELASTKEYLQHTIEEQQSSNEELQSMNEELQASNEELQSTNEELETSKEEIQSINEELVTVNAELQSKIEELSHANNDLNNLLASTDIAVIFLDNNLVVKRFTPAATKLVNLIQSDIGRPMEQITTLFDGEALVKDSREVLKTLAFKQREVHTKKGLWYEMRIIPYRTMENVIDGIVMTFIDITEHRKVVELARASEEKYQILCRTTQDGIALLDEQGHISESNLEFQRQTGRKAEQLKKMKLWSLSPHGDMEEVRKAIAYIKEKGGVSSKEMKVQKPEGEIVTLEFDGKAVIIRGKKFIHIVTRRKKTKKGKK
ncbi:MAG TPA: chemotaxis protein CheB [Thermodesulfovibrionales bacterium]|nr:chemotaxis protein CheB [Thermodesulfovibrionales bacterium]